MPTILVILGWRFFFYSNERDEPIHVHCQKGGAEGKYWLDVDGFDVIEAFARAMSPADRRTVRKIIFANFEYIVSQWAELQEKRHDD
jgi:formylmethanofuran dehydrogenase subunit A